MIVVKDLASVQQISNTPIRELVRQRIDDLGGEGFDSAEIGYILVAQSGDTSAVLSSQLGFDVLCNRMTGIRYDEAGFTPSFEFVEEFPSCYDLVFIISDDGFGVELLVPNTKGVDPDLLAMCAKYAVQGTV